ncbi:MAG: ATP-binding protein [Colwellia sp.]|nr:ATP-binding protein [Colwellia sp.]
MKKVLTLAQLRKNIFFLVFLFFVVVIVTATAFIYVNTKEKIIALHHDAFHDRSQLLESAIMKNTDFVYVMRNIFNQYIDKNISKDELSKYIQDIQKVAIDHDDKNYHLFEIDGTIGSHRIKNTIFSSGNSKQLDLSYVQKLIAALNMQDFQFAAQERNASVVMSYFLSINGNVSSLYPIIPIEKLINNFDSLVSFTDQAYEVYNGFASPQINPEKKHFWTDPYLDRAGNGMMVTCAIPTYDNGEYSGVIGVDIVLTFLNKFVEKSLILNGDSFLISQKEFVITASNINYKNEQELVLFNSIINKKQKLTDHLIFEYSLTNAPWRFVYLVSHQKITQKILEESMLYNLASIFALLSLVIGYFTINNFFIKPAISSEQKLKAANKDLNSTKDELQQNLADLKNTQQKMIESEKLAALGVLVTGIAHEINTPLGVAITSSSCAHENSERINKLFSENAMTKSDFTHFLSFIDESSTMVNKNLNRVADLVKDFKSVSAQSNHYALSEFDFSHYLHQIVKLFMNLHNPISHKINIQCDAFTITSYEVAFDQIITNLLENSINHAFTPEQQGEINLKISRKNGQIELCYSDNGQGISADEKTKVFEPFYTTKRINNVGLGLFIVHNIVKEKLNGDIEIDEDLSQGLAFKITWPNNH